MAGVFAHGRHFMQIYSGRVLSSIQKDNLGNSTKTYLSVRCTDCTHELIYNGNVDLEEGDFVRVLSLDYESNEKEGEDSPRSDLEAVVALEKISGGSVKKRYFDAGLLREVNLNFEKVRIIMNGEKS